VAELLAFTMQWDISHWFFLLALLLLARDSISGGAENTASIQSTQRRDASTMSCGVGIGLMISGIVQLPVGSVQTSQEGPSAFVPLWNTYLTIHESIRGKERQGRYLREIPLSLV